jgi:hypothetical protein
MTLSRLRRLPLTAALLAAMIFCPPPCGAAEADQGLVERLHYDLFFGPLPVGRAVISEYALVSPAGELSNYVFEAESYAVVDVVYKVRDHVESVHDRTGGRSLWYLKSILAEDGRVTSQTRFNWKKAIARRIIGGEVESRVFLPEGVLDPLSVMYKVREFSLSGFGVHEMLVTDGKSLEKALFQVEKREKIKAPTGKYNAFKVRVDLFSVESPLNTGGENHFTVWVAPEHGNLPVKIAAPIDLGPFNGVLNAALVRAESHPLE